MSSLEHSAMSAAARLARVGAAVRAQLQLTLPTLAEQAAAYMRQATPKFRSTLTNSIRAEREADLQYLIGPHVDSARWVDQGRKPGKGLPRFFDPASASAVAWLEARIGDVASLANPRYRKAGRGTARYTAEELALRDRYMAWSRHVRRYGIKAQPFVKPTSDHMRPLVQSELAAAVQRGMRQALGQGSSQGGSA